MSFWMLVFGGGAGCVSLAGMENQKARDWYQKNDMTVLAYSSLGRGFFSGKISSFEKDKAKEVLDEFAVKGYCYEENFERLKRAELLAKEKNCTVSQIALAWTLAQPLKTVLLASSKSKKRMEENGKAFEVCLTDKECLWLDCQVETL